MDKIIFVILMSLLPNAQAQYTYNINYRVNSFRGEVIPWGNDGIRFHVGISATEDELKKYAHGGLLTDLKTSRGYRISDKDLYRRILMFIGQTAFEAGIPEWRASLYMIADETPGLTMTEADLAKIEDKLQQAGIELRAIDPPSGHGKIVGQDIRPFLTRRQNMVEQLIAESMTHILGFAAPGRHGVIDYRLGVQGNKYLRTVNLRGLLDKIKGANLLGGNDDAPDRTILKDREGRVLNLAQMTAAESNWYEVIGTLRYNLEQITERLLKVQSEPIASDLRKSVAIGQLVENAHKMLDGQQRAANDNETEEQRKEKENRVMESLASTVGFQLSWFAFDRHSQRQFFQMDPIVLLPLYSFGLISLLDQIADFSSDSWAILGDARVETSIITILQPYLDEEYKMDNLTLDALQTISKLRQLHPLLRLTAFAIIEKHLGFEEATHITGIDRGNWKALYERASERVVLSPVHGGVHLIAHIDYTSDSKYRVHRLVQAVEESAAKNFGLGKLVLKERYTIKDPTLPSFADSRGEQLLRKFADNRRHNGGKLNAPTTRVKQIADFYIQPVTQPIFLNENCESQVISPK